MDVNVKDNHNNTAFTLALQRNPESKETLELYLNHGASMRPTFESEFNERTKQLTPLLYLFSRRIKNLDLIKWYLDHGASINDCDDAGNDALHYAIFNNSKKLARFVLSCPGYNTAHVDKQGRNAFHHVVQPTEYGSYENVGIL